MKTVLLPLQVLSLMEHRVFLSHSFGAFHLKRHVFCIRFSAVSFHPVVVVEGSEPG